MGEPVRATSTGLGRVLVTVYAVFAFSATGRSSVQLLTKFEQAPTAYSLSALAAFVYLAATLGLAQLVPRARVVAWVAVVVELVGVLVVGTTSVLLPATFPDATVWSQFGAGYGYLPVVLPFVGVWWLLRTRAAPRTEAPSAGGPAGSQ